MRYKERQVRLYFRGDAAFASPEIYEYLEAEGLLYVIRLKANADSPAEHCPSAYATCRPPDHVRRFHASFSYQAGSWNKEAPCCGQSGAAPRRAGSSRRFHRH